MQMLAMGRYAKRISDRKRKTKRFICSYNSYKLRDFKPMGGDRVKPI